MIGEIDFIFVFGSIWKHFQGSFDCPIITPPDYTRDFLELSGKK